MADGFAMAILYKNAYKQTIFTEVGETLGRTGPRMTADNVEPILEVDAIIEPSIVAQNDNTL
jgi:hypothetical protein